MAAAAVATPASSDTRAPHTSRASRSRPNSSVPSAWPGDSGGRRRFGVSTVSGSGSGSHGASAATSTAATSATAAATASTLRPRGAWAGGAVALARLSLIPDARVEPRVEQVDAQVDQRESQGDDQHAALDERKVAGQDPLHHERADAGPREDRLGEHGAAQQVAGLDADHGHDRDERVLQ